MPETNTLEQDFQPEAPSLETDFQEEPQLESEIAQIQALRGLSPAQRMASFGAAKIPSSILESQQIAAGYALPSEAPAKVLEPVTKAVGGVTRDLVSSFLQSWGIAPPSEGEPFVQLQKPMTREQWQQVPKALQIPAAFLEAGSEIGQGIIQPENAPFFFTGRPGAATLGFQQLASLPQSSEEALGTLQDPRATLGEKALSVAKPAATALLGRAILGHGLDQQLERKQAYARSQQEAAEVYGDVRTQPIEGEGEVPAEGGRPGIRPREEGEEAEVLLSDLFQNNRKLGIGHEHELVDVIQGDDPNNPLSVAQALPAVVDEYGDFMRPGKIQISRKALQKWWNKTAPEKRLPGLRAMVAEEGIHAMITDAEAKAYLDTLSPIERRLRQALYLGEMGPEQVQRFGWTPNRFAHEALRQTLQRLLRLDPTEVAELAGAERWSRRSVEFLANFIRSARELLPTREGIGTEAARAGKEMTQKFLDRFTENIDAAANGISEEIPTTQLGGEQPFSIRRSAPTPEEETNDPAQMAKVIGPVKYDGIMDFKLPGLKPKWQFTLTTPGRQTTFMLDVGSSLKDVWRKTSIKEYQFEHHIADQAEAEKRWAEETGQSRPAAPRRKKDTETPELNLPPIVPQPTPQEVRKLQEEPGAAGAAGLLQVPPEGAAPVPPGPGVREGELALPPVPKGAYVERNRPAPAPQELAQSASQHFDREIAAGNAPDFKSFSGELQSQYGALSQEKLFNAYQDAWNQRLMKAPAAELDKIVDDLNLRGKLQAEHQQTFAPGTIAEPVEIPKEHQAQFEALARQFPHNKVPTPREVRQFFSQTLRRRYSVIAAILDKVTKGAPERKALDRSEVGPEEISQLAGERLFRSFTAGEAVDAQTVGELATRGAAMDATGKGAPPRTVSKNLIALRDKSGRFILVSAWRDPRSGPRITNPSDPSGPSRKIDNELLADYRPQATMTLREPAKGFHRVFDNVNDFYKWFGDAGVPGTSGLRTSMFTGPHADIARIAQQPGVGGAARPPEAPTGREFLQSVLPEGLSEFSQELKTPGRAPIPLRSPFYRSPRPGPPPAEKLPLNEQLEAARRAREMHPYQPTAYEPSPELAKRGIQIMPGAGGERPFGIRRSAKAIDDEIEALKDKFMKFRAEGAVAQLLSSDLDSTDNRTTINSRQIGTAIRIASSPPQTSRLKALVTLPEGDPKVLSAANVLVESGFNQNRIADFRAKVAEGRVIAQDLLRTGNHKERDIARAKLRELRGLDQELDYADKNWDDPRLQSTARRMKRELDADYGRAKAAGINLNKDPEYLPHRYVTMLVPGILGRRFQLPQVYPTYYDAAVNPEILAITRDGATLVEHRVRQTLQRINQEAWENSLKNVMVGGQPVAMDLVDIGGGRKVPPNLGYQTVNLGPGRSIAIQKGYGLPELMEQLTGRNVIQDWKYTRAALHLSQRLKHGMLIGDFFHLTKTLYFAASIMNFKAGFTGGWSILDIAERDIPDAVRKGFISQADADWGNQFVGGTGMSRRMLAQRFYSQMGLNVGRIQDALYKDLLTQYDPRWGTVRGIAKHLVDPSIGRYNRFLFDKLTRGLMAESAIREFERQSKARPDVPPERVMRDIARDVNVYFGNLGRQGFLKARWQQDLARIFWLAPQWVEGLIRKEATAYSRWTGVSQALGRRGVTYAGTTGRGIATGLGFMFGLTQAINLITRGHTTFQNPEKGHQFDAWIPSFGSQKEGFWFSPMAVFNELSHDLYRLIMDKPSIGDAIMQIAGNKQSPLFRAAVVGWTGMSPTGEKQLTTASRLKTAAEQLIPYPITFGKYMQAAGHAVAPETIRAPTPGTLQRSFFGSLGMKIEPAKSPGQQMKQLADDFMEKEHLKKDTGWQEIQTEDPSYAKLRNAVRNDDEAGARKVYLGLLEHNHSRADVMRAMQMWKERGFTGSRENESLFKRSLTEEQREAYGEAVDRKYGLYDKFKDWSLNWP
jgi:hypothetical protein